MGTARSEQAKREVKLPYTPRRWADGLHDTLARWIVLVLHRRAGKTTAIINHHQRAATNDAWEAARLKRLQPDLRADQIRDLLRGRFYGHILPTYAQAELTTWKMLKDYADLVPGAKANEQKLSITYAPTPMNRIGSTLRLFGADKPDRLRGPAFSGLSFDEFGQHPPNIFSEVLSKALADHLGYAIFAGTIKGKNQLWRTYQAGKGDPMWFALWQDIDESLRTEDDAAILTLRQAMHDDRQLIAKGLMSQEEFDQEWYLSVEAAIKGSYYSKLIAQARKDGRIARVPYDPVLPVDTDWDLGVADVTTIWFSQSLRSREIRLVDYYENSGEGLAHYARILNERAQERGYVYGKHYAPHDIQVREFGTGKSRLEMGRSLGLNFEVGQQLPLSDGINAVRAILPRCWFNEATTEGGLAALTHYRKSWHSRLNEFTKQPVHDWASHGADAFRGLALRHQPPQEAEKRKERERTRLIMREGAQGREWMRVLIPWLITGVYLC